MVQNTGRASSTCESSVHPLGQTLLQLSVKLNGVLPSQLCPERQGAQAWHYYLMLSALIVFPKETFCFLYCFFATPTSSWVYLSKWRNFTKDVLGLQWPLWGTLTLNKFVHLRNAFEIMHQKIMGNRINLLMSRGVLWNLTNSPQYSGVYLVLHYFWCMPQINTETEPDTPRAHSSTVMGK